MEAAKGYGLLEPGAVQSAPSGLNRHEEYQRVGNSGRRAGPLDGGGFRQAGGPVDATDEGRRSQFIRWVGGSELPRANPPTKSNPDNRSGKGFCHETRYPAKATAG